MRVRRHQVAHVPDRALTVSFNFLSEFHGSTAFSHLMDLGGICSFPITLSIQLPLCFQECGFHCTLIVGGRGKIFNPWIFSIPMGWVNVCILIHDVSEILFYNFKLLFFYQSLFLPSGLAISTPASSTLWFACCSNALPSPSLQNLAVRGCCEPCIDKVLTFQIGSDQFQICLRLSPCT